MRIVVWGAGSWGTALAIVLARAGHAVRLVARNEAAAQALAERRENARYLPGIALPASVQPQAPSAKVFADADILVLALPSAALAEALDACPALNAAIVVATKGMTPDGGQTAAEFVAARTGRPVAVLTGPSFAREVAEGKPTAMTLAAPSLAEAEALAHRLAAPGFRLYAHDDWIGAAMGGALKNVVAIAAGVAEGMGLGHNAVAAVITRGLAEIARLARRRGGRRETLMGLSGLGDLVLTCTGDLSRNRRLGMALAKGASLEEARAAIGQVVEGVGTARAARRLAERLGVEAPLIAAVAAVVDGTLAPREAVQQLLARPLRPELEE